jgi:hypothetical protein
VLADLHSAIGTIEAVTCVEARIFRVADVLAFTVSDHVSFADRHAFEARLHLAFLADDAVATIEVVSCIVALFVADVVVDVSVEARLDAAVVHPDRAFRTVVACAIVEVPVSVVAD